MQEIQSTLTQRRLPGQLGTDGVRPSETKQPGEFVRGLCAMTPVKSSICNEHRDYLGMT